MAAASSCALFERMTAPLMELAHSRQLVTSQDRWNLEDAMLYTLKILEVAKGQTWDRGEQRTQLLRIGEMLAEFERLADDYQKRTNQNVAHFNDVRTARFGVELELKSLGVVGKTWEITEESAEELDRLVKNSEPGPGRLNFTPRPAVVGDRSLLN